MKFCLKRENRTSVKTKDFEDINWFNVNDRFNQIVATNVFKFFLKCGPDYMDEIYFPADQVNIKTRFSYQKSVEDCLTCAPLSRSSHTFLLSLKQRDSCVYLTHLHRQHQAHVPLFFLLFSKHV